MSAKKKPEEETHQETMARLSKELKQATSFGEQSRVIGEFDRATKEFMKKMLQAPLELSKVIKRLEDGEPLEAQLRKKAREAEPRVAHPVPPLPASAAKQGGGGSSNDSVALH